MKNFIKHFRREYNGAWRCVASAELETVKGRVQVTPGTRFAPGTLFMGIDLVGMLEDEYNKVNGHGSPLFTQLPEDSMQGPQRPL